MTDTLVVAFDVTHLSPAERESLLLHVVVQAEAYDDGADDGDAADDEPVNYPDVKVLAHTVVPFEIADDDGADLTGVLTVGRGL